MTIGGILKKIAPFAVAGALASCTHKPEPKPVPGDDTTHVDTTTKPEPKPEPKPKTKEDSLLAINPILVGKHVMFSEKWLDVFKEVWIDSLPIRMANPNFSKEAIELCRISSEFSEEEVAKKFDEWRDSLDKVYEMYVELTGYNTDPKSYNGKVLYDVSAHDPRGNGHAHVDKSDICFVPFAAHWQAEGIITNEKNQGRVAMHEMSHIFDNGKGWRFDNETLADIKIAYALSHGMIYIGSCAPGCLNVMAGDTYLNNTVINTKYKYEQFQMLQTDDKRFQEFQNTSPSDESAYAMYLFTFVKNLNDMMGGEAGWNALKAAFRKFEGDTRNNTSQYLGTAYEKIFGMKYAGWKENCYTDDEWNWRNREVAAIFFNEMAFAAGYNETTRKDLFATLPDSGKLLYEVEDVIRNNLLTTGKSYVRSAGATTRGTAVHKEQTTTCDHSDERENEKKLIKTTNKKGFLISDVMFKSGFDVSDPHLAAYCASNYSEGSKELENLLLYLWKRRLETVSTCSAIKGFDNHKRPELYNREPFPHVAFVINSKNRNRIANMISNFTKEDFSVFDVSIRSCEDRYFGETIVFECRNSEHKKMLDTETSNKIFKNLSELFARTLDVKTPKANKLPAAAYLAKFISGIPNPEYPYMVRLAYSTDATLMEVHLSDKRRDVLRINGIKDGDLKNIDGIIENAVSKIKSELTTTA